MTKLEEYIESLNKREIQLAKKFGELPSRSVATIIGDMVAGAKEKLSGFGKESRKFQKDCEKTYQGYLTLYSDEKAGKLDGFNLDDAYLLVMHGEHGPISKFVEYRDSYTGNPSRSKPIKGEFDKRVTYEGFCMVNDSNGVPQYMFAKVSDTSYTNVKSDSSSGELMNVLEGFYRLPDGRFVEIYEKHHPLTAANYQNVFADLEYRANTWLESHGYSNLISTDSEADCITCD